MQLSVEFKILRQVLQKLKVNLEDMVNLNQNLKTILKII